MAERSRRETKSKSEKFAEYKRVRAGGGRTLKVRELFARKTRVIATFQDEEVEIYDEVTEDQYKSIVRGRLQKDDFIEDDGVDGYMDNGMDDWLDEQDGDSEEELDRKKKSTSIRVRNFKLTLSVYFSKEGQERLCEGQSKSQT